MADIMQQIIYATTQQPYDGSSYDWLTMTSPSITSSSNMSATRRTGMPVPSEECVRYWFIMYTVLSGMLCTLGLLGNAVSFAVFWADRQKTSTSFLFQCLAIVDNLLLLTIFPLYVLPYLALYTGKLQYFMRHVFAYVQVYVLPCTFIVQTATIWLTVLVGVNRYVAVCHPYQATRLCSIRQARRQVLVVLVSSIAYCIPKFFVGYIQQVSGPKPLPNVQSLSSVGNTVTAWTNDYYMNSLNVASTTTSAFSLDSGDYVIMTSFLPSVQRVTSVPLLPPSRGALGVKAGKTQLGESVLFQVVYNNALYLVCLLVVPLLLLTLLNARLVRSLQELKNKRAKMQVSEKQRQESNVTFVLIIVVLVFCVCQAPALVNQIFWNVLPEQARWCGGFQFYLSPICNVLVILNSSVNFVIYLLCNTRFQQTLAERFCCCLPASCRRAVSPRIRSSLSVVEPRYLALSTAPPRNDNTRSASATAGLARTRCNESVCL